MTLTLLLICLGISKVLRNLVASYVAITATGLVENVYNNRCGNINLKLSGFYSKPQICPSQPQADGGAVTPQNARPWNSVLVILRPGLPYSLVSRLKLGN